MIQHSKPRLEISSRDAAALRVTTFAHKDVCVQGRLWLAGLQMGALRTTVREESRQEHT